MLITNMNMIGYVMYPTSQSYILRVGGGEGGIAQRPPSSGARGCHLPHDIAITPAGAAEPTSSGKTLPHHHCLSRFYLYFLYYISRY